MEAKLRRSEARYDRAADAGQVGVWEWDLLTNEIYVEPRLKAMLGYQDREIPNRIEDWRAKVHPEDRDLVMREASRHLEGVTPLCEIEHRMVHKDGSTRWFLARGSVARDEDGRAIRISGTDTDITELRLAQQAVRELSGRLIHGQEGERGRIARELHDDLGQKLALLEMRIQLSLETPPNSAKATGKILKVLLEQLKNLSSDVQHLAYRLHPPKLASLGLPVALESLCRELTEQTHVTVELEEISVGDPIASETALCLYRIAQECLQNVTKHSGADRARVALDQSDDSIVLRVSDQGVGFDVEAVSGLEGLGIASMRERLRFFAGRLSIRSTPGNGTEVEASIPKRHAGDPA